MLLGLKGFEWDEGNRDKNEKKHGVTSLECEEIFHNRPLIAAKDPRHSTTETRYTALGRTHGKRLLFVAFTVRKDKIRIISARPMSRKERIYYEKEIKA
jgi:uncharacterized DUF497 family protein